MVDYATVFGALFLIVVLVFTVWITWISVQDDRHGPAIQDSTGDAGGE